MREAIWLSCSGQAHTPDVDQDNCGICMPFWGDYPTCPDCGWKLRVRKVGLCRNPTCTAFKERLSVKNRPAAT